MRIAIIIAAALAACEIPMIQGAADDFAAAPMTPPPPRDPGCWIECDDPIDSVGLCPCPEK